MNAILRLPPCPAYDIPGWESWLEDMGRSGLTPAKFDNHLPFVRFEHTSPKEYRYRMEPVQRREQEPEEGLLALARELGWEYVGRRGLFFVFRTEDPHAPELHTEPETQAISLRYLRKYLLRGLCALALELAFFGGILLPQLGWSLVEFGSLLVLPLLLSLLTMAAGNALGLVRIARLCRGLRSGRPMAHRRDWRKGAAYHRLLSILSWVMILLLLCSWCVYECRDLGFGSIPLAEYPGQPPFVTLDALAEDGEIDHIRNNEARSWSDPLFPVCIHWIDGAGVTWPDGEWTAGLHIVQYCEARTPWLAELVARSYLTANRHRHDSGPEELTHLGVDYAAGFTDDFGQGPAITRAVIVEGCTVVCVELQISTREISMERWLEQMASQLSAP